MTDITEDEISEMVALLESGVAGVTEQVRAELEAMFSADEDVTPADQNKIVQTIVNWDQHSVADSERAERIMELYARVLALQRADKAVNYNNPPLKGNQLESVAIWTAKDSKTFEQHVDKPDFISKGV